MPPKHAESNLENVFALQIHHALKLPREKSYLSGVDLSATALFVVHSLASELIVQPGCRNDRIEPTANEHERTTGPE